MPTRPCTVAGSLGTVTQRKAPCREAPSIPFSTLLLVTLNPQASRGRKPTLHRRHRRGRANAGTQRNKFLRSTSLGKRSVFWRVLCRTVRCPVTATVPVSHPSHSLCRAAPPILTLDVPLGLPQPAGHQRMSCDTLERVLLKRRCCRRRSSLDPMRLRGRTPAPGSGCPKV
ncbi:unnamed protein product [Rangifer tarandus platyrhynchus]|uniref:Uncharacterized protein n=1 Tax=Rangifer tarandus platyrhynchus TaxID=3082113 RepID=A0AC59ZNG0_RANTA